jgi:hypothetical protein
MIEELMRNLKKLYFIGVFILGCVLVALLGSSSLSQTPAPQRSTQTIVGGRFQLHEISTGNAYPIQVLLLDTETGRIWARVVDYTGKSRPKWVEEGPFVATESPK